MFCRKCGSELVDDAVFCPKCGTKVLLAEETLNVKESETIQEKGSEKDSEIVKEQKLEVKQDSKPENKNDEKSETLNTEGTLGEYGTRPTDKQKTGLSDKLSKHFSRTNEQTGNRATIDNFRKKPKDTKYKFEDYEAPAGVAGEVVAAEAVSNEAEDPKIEQIGEEISVSGEAVNTPTQDAIAPGAASTTPGEAAFAPEVAATTPEVVATSKLPMNKKKKRIIIGSIAAVVVLAVIAAIVIPIIIKSNQYDEATQLMEAGKYGKAKVIFQELSSKDYEDSADKVIYCKNMIAYEKAEKLLEAKEYYEAYKIFTRLGTFGFEDAGEKANDCVQPEPAQGTVYRSSGLKSEVSLKIKIASGMGNKYIKIYDKSDKVLATVFVKSGSSATIKLPATTIKIKTASGTKWFGETDMYGEEGSYQTQLIGENKETVTLQRNYTYTLSLGGVTNGNVPAENVDPDDM